MRFTVSLLALLVTAALPMPNQVMRNGVHTTVDPLFEARFSRDVLAVGFDMLRARGVPFDPEILAEPDWRSELEPALPLMPEMSGTIHVRTPMKGVYLGGAVLLPEHVTLSGDTFILTGEFAPDEENTAINIRGDYSLFVYVIGNPKKNAAMLRSGRRGVPPMVFNFDVMSPSVLEGIEPHYIGRGTFRGSSRPHGGLVKGPGGWLLPDMKIVPSGIPHLLDPDFEAFRLAPDPLSGWYSEVGKDPKDSSVTMTPDSQIKVQGRSSLRIEQTQPRPKDRGQAFLTQAVRLLRQGGLTRNFDLSVQARGASNGRVTMELFGLDAGNITRRIAQRDIKLPKDWKTTTLRFTVPEGYDQFAVRFSLPREVAQLWLDDVRLTPNLRGQP